MDRRRLLTTMMVGSLCASAAAPPSTRVEPARHDWREYGGHQGARYSTLARIDRVNVRKLQVAWRYDTGETGGLQTQPLMVDGLFYANTPGHRVIALDASSGALVWKFDAGIASRGPNRGVTYWSNGPEARVFASVSTFLYALDARTGEVKKDFGEGGRIDLRRGLGRDDELLAVTLTTPGVVYRDLLIVGSVTGERLPASPGDIRAYDVAHRRVALDVPHHSAARRARRRHLAAGRVAAHRRRQQLGRHDRSTKSAASSTCRRARRHSTSTAPTATATTSSPTASRARSRHRQADLALPGRPARHLGQGPAVAADARHRQAGRPHDARPSRRPPSRDHSSSSSA